jgi:dihydroneopterin aldolase
MDRLTLTGMRFEGRHGVGEEERRYPQTIEVDVDVEADLAASAESDDLGDTLDYGPLVEIVRRRVEDGSFHLLEAIAGTIATDILGRAPRATAVTVRARKLAVPVAADMDHAQVELRRERAPSDAAEGSAGRPGQGPGRRGSVSPEPG